jgi:hypothetical protein
MEIDIKGMLNRVSPAPILSDVRAAMQATRDQQNAFKTADVNYNIAAGNLGTARGRPEEPAAAMLHAQAAGNRTLAELNQKDFKSNLLQQPNVVSGKGILWILGTPIILLMSLFGGLSDLFKNIFNFITLDLFHLKTSDEIIEIPNKVVSPETIRNELQDKLSPQNFDNLYNELQVRLTNVTSKIQSSSDIGDLGRYSQELEVIKTSFNEMKDVLLKKGLVSDPNGNLLRSIDYLANQAKLQQDLTSKSIDMITRGLTDHNVLTEIAKYGGILVSSAAIAYVLTTFLKDKFGDTAKLKIFDYKLDNNLKNLKRLGIRDIDDFHNKLLEVKSECASSTNFSYHQNDRLFINLEHSMRCYLTYTTSLVIGIFTLFISNMKLLNQDISGLRDVKTILKCNFNKPVIEILNNIYSDYLSMLQTIVTDNSKVGQILHHIDSSVSTSIFNLQRKGGDNAK